MSGRAGSPLGEIANFLYDPPFSLLFALKKAAYPFGSGQSRDGTQRQRDRLLTSTQAVEFSVDPQFRLRWSLRWSSGQAAKVELTRLQPEAREDR
jgi:hypothetical protein